MSYARAIVLIEDDPDDIHIFRMAMGVLNVDAPLHCFTTAQEALSYLQTVEPPPGLILCNHHLSAVSGIDLRETLAKDARMQRRSIPFILLSTTISEASIRKAFELPVQGIFLKQPTFEKHLEQLDRILKYWSASITPNSPHPEDTGWE